MKKTPPTAHQSPNGWLSWWLPTWLKASRHTCSSDIIAGVMMGVLVIPQSLGYAALAGLPPVMGLYAAIVPTLVYAYFGASSVQAVGPVAITAIMTASSLANLATADNYISLATTLALMVGVILMIASWLRLGWIMQFISRGVSAGFISAAAVLIILGQLKGLIRLPIQGDNLLTMFHHLAQSSSLIHLPTALLGITALTLLIISRYKSQWLWGYLPKSVIPLASRLFVLVLVAVCIIASRHFHWQPNLDIATISPLPSHLALPSHWQLPTAQTINALLPSALLIAFIAFVSTATISRTHATQRQENYIANKELLSLGAANITSSLFGGFSVAGGLSRTSLNVALGAKSPLASVVCALVILLILLFFSGVLTDLPYAILSAIIISSVLSMIDVQTLKDAYHHDKHDFFSFLASFFGVCFFGLNVGLVAGLLTAFAALIYQSHKPHIAILGQVGTSEHFRNILRHDARTFDNLLLLRIDESLYFGNANLTYDTIMHAIDRHPNATHIVLVMTAVNHVDLTAQQMLIRLNADIIKHAKQLHYAEIKGPIMDTLSKTNVLQSLSGKVFLSTMLAVQTLNQTSP